MRRNTSERAEKEIFWSRGHWSKIEKDEKPENVSLLSSKNLETPCVGGTRRSSLRDFTTARAGACKSQRAVFAPEREKGGLFRARADCDTKQRAVFES
jgi:hypothetical protein